MKRSAEAMSATTDMAGAGGKLPTVELLLSGAGAAWLCLQAESSPVPSLALRAAATALALTPLIRVRRADSDLARVAALAAFVFLATGAMTLPFTYDRSVAVGKLLMLVGGVGLGTAVASQATTQLLSVARLFVLAVCGLGVYFIATNEWFAPPVKFHALAAAGDALGRLLPDVPGPRIHPNVVAGILASLSPWVVVWWRTATGIDRYARRGVALLVIAALVLTVSRAAWVGLLVVGAAWWSTSLMPPEANKRQRSGATWTVGAIAVLAVMAIALLVGFSGVVPESLARYGRLSVQHRALGLVRDYVLTGAGLGTFPLQFAIYSESGTSAGSVHAHNAAIDVVVEQGLGGLVSAGVLGLLTLLAAWRARRRGPPQVSIFAEGAAASALVIAVHGLMDDTLYGSRGAVVLFVPIGLALAAYRDAEGGESRRGTLRWLVVPGVLVAVVGVLAVLPAGRAVWHANRGALEQARAELPGVSRARLNSPTLDQVRAQASLDGSIDHFTRALALDPTNLTASRRLAAIYLSLARYDDAWRTIAPSVEAGAGEYATRAVAADVFVATGRVAEAATLLRGDPLAVYRVLSTAWYRYWLANDRVRAADAWRTVLILEPGQPMATEWLNIALTRPDWVNR